MHQINTTTKKFTEAVTIDLGQLPTVDTRIDFILTDGSNPVIAENKTFAMTIGTVLGSLYKTDNDTVSFRYLKFNDDNIADTLVITMTMDGVEILNDTVSLKYQRECIDKGALEEAINAKADKATTIAGYGITDAYTKTEIDAKVASVYHYKGTVSAYADLPVSGQEVGDVWNIETADSTHGIKAGDNVAWTGSEWDVLAGEIDLSAYATKTELETKMDAPATGTVGQVLTKTEDGQEWADAPAGGGGEDTTDYLCFTADEAGDTVRLNKVGTPPTISLEYSVDKKTWTEYTWDGNTGATITLANVGDSVYFRGNNSTFSTSTSNYYNFQFSALTRASGNIMSLLDKTCESVTIPTDYCFNTLFRNTTKLKTPPKLPALYLTAWCYYYMFRSSGIVVAPELPAVTMKEACYSSMFEDSRSLIIAPELPATTLAPKCYLSMFNQSYELTVAPSILPATTLASECYTSMFEWCQKLQTVPILPATTLVERCYGRMFYACKSLKGTIEIMATTLANACMTLMIPSGVEKVKVHFTDFGNYTANWMGSSGATGVFECPSALDCSTRDKSHVPAGWTIVRTDAPKSITSPTTASSEATYQVSPNTPSVPVVTVASALTLNATTKIYTGGIAYAEIVLDVATGATVTAGTNLTLVDTPTAGKRNICVCRWSGGVCKLYVTIVEDLPQA